jgi:hypothetical protein
MNARIACFTLALGFAPLGAHAFDRNDADTALAAASTAVQAAERGDASQYAGADLASAHDMLNIAQAAYDHRDWSESVFHAENAKADADLAAARSRQMRAEQATAQVERSVQSLRDQLGISGDRP